MATIAGAAKGMSVFVYLRATADQFAADMEKAAKTAKNHAKDFKAVGESLTKYVTLPLTAAGGAAIYAAVEIDKGLDKIRTSTGATGKRMAELEQSFKTVFKAVPTDAETAGMAIAELSTRTGQTGKALEDLAKQELELARITGEDLKGQIEASTRVFGDWSIATESQGAAMDFMFKTSQATGVGFTDLSNKLVQFGAPLRQMGFDFETSAALLGKFHKEGVNTELVMGSMRIALGKMAKEGITDANQALQAITGQIKAVGSASEANRIAIEMFGARAGPDMAAAIREGRFEVNQLVKDLKASDETILKAAEATKDFGDRWIQSKNKIMLALEPVGTKILEVLDQKVIPLVVKAGDVLQVLVDWFSDLDDSTQTTVIVLAGLAAAAGPVILAISGIYSSAAAVLPVLSSLAAGIKGLSLANLQASATAAAGSLGVLKTAALAAAAAFIGWEIGRLIGELTGLDQVVQKLFTSWFFAERVDEANKALEQSTVRLAQTLRDKYHVEIERGAMSLEQYNTKLQQAMTAAMAQDPAFRKAAEAARLKKEAEERAAKAAALHAQAQAEAAAKAAEQAEQTKKLVSEFKNALRPADDLNKKLQTLLKEGFSRAELVVIYGKDVAEAAERHRELGATIPPLIAYLDKVHARLNISSLDLKLESDQLSIASRSWNDLANLGLKPNITTTNLLTQEQLKLTKQLGDLKGLPVQVAADVQALSQKGLSNAEIMLVMGDQLKRAGDLSKQLGIQLDPATEALIRQMEAADENAQFAKQWENAWSTSMGNLTSKFTDWLSGMLSRGNQFAKNFLNIFLQQLLNPLYKALARIGSNVANAFTGLLGGQGAGGFSLSNLFSGVNLGGLTGQKSPYEKMMGTAAPSWGGLATGGLAAGGGLGFGYLGGKLGGKYGQMIGNVGGSLVGMGVGAHLGWMGAGAQSGWLGSLGGLMTNPWTIGIGGGIAATLLIRKLLQKDAYKSGGKEFGRDLGMEVSAKTIEQFVGSLGIAKKQYEGIRADVQWSPKMLQEVLLPQAIQEGPAAVEALIQKYSEIETVMGNADWSEAVRKAVETGAWQDLNEQYNTLFSKSNALVAAMPDFATKLAAVTDEAAEAAAKFWKLDEYTQALVQDFAATGIMSDDLRAKLQGLSGVDAALLESQGAEIAKLQELQGEFGQLQEYLVNLIPPAESAIDKFLKTGQITDDLRREIEGLGGDIAKFEAFAKLTQEAQAAEMSLSEYIATNASAAAVAKDLAGELGTLQDTLGAKIQSMVEKFTAAIDLLIEALGNVTPAAEAAGDAVANVPSALTGEAGESKSEKSKKPKGGNPKHLEPSEPEGSAGKETADFTKFDSGGWVTRTGLAKVHAGELVLPGEIASRLNRKSPQVPVINFSWNSPPVVINGVSRETADNLVEQFREIVETNKGKVITELTRRVSDMMRTEVA